MGKNAKRGCFLSRSKTLLACRWRLEPDDDFEQNWISGCGELWEFIKGGPVENGVRYCPHCGRPVKANSVLGATGEQK